MISEIEKFDNDGYLIIKECLTSSDISLIKDTASNYTQLNPEYFKNNFPRVVNLHMQNLDILNIFNNKIIFNILNKILDGFSIYTSLFFKYPTQQPLHMDSPVFHTYPQGNFVGFWIALEDVNLNNGPLMVVPRSHLIEYLNPKKFLLDKKLLPENAWNVYQDENVQNLKKKLPNFEIKKLIVNKGDIVIWHANLMHGGSKSINPNFTRESIVFHITGYENQVYQHNEFFNEVSLGNLKQKLIFNKYKSISYQITDTQIGSNR